MKSLTHLKAPAKLNLFLHVVGQRPNGYHELQSLFIFIDWADTLHFERRNDGRIQRHDLSQHLPADDLCIKAALLLQSNSGCELGVDISIDKQLPFGAGMGGGSSDAATTLLALNKLWNLNWPRQRLLDLGLQLGADVPFFIEGQPAIVKGIGEQIYPIQLPDLHYAVIKPAPHIDTRTIFTDALLKKDTDPDIVMNLLAQEAVNLNSFGSGRSDKNTEQTLPVLSQISLRRLMASTRNDLEPVAKRLCPEVAQASLWLASHWGNSRMTGSGSAVFASETAENTHLLSALGCCVLSKLPFGWSGRICQSLPVHPLRHLAN